MGRSKSARRSSSALIEGGTIARFFLTGGAASCSSSSEPGYSSFSFRNWSALRFRASSHNNESQQHMSDRGYKIKKNTNTLPATA